MKKLVSRPFIFAGMVAIIVLTLSWITARVYANGSFVQWTELGAPPEPIVAFLSFDVDIKETGTAIVVETTDGGVYQGSEANCLGGSSCWVPVDDAPGLPDDTEFSVEEECNTFEGMATRPGNVTSCLSYRGVSSGSHLIYYGNFALLEDGTMQVWQFVPGSGALMIILLGGIVALASGLLTPIVLVIGSRIRTQRMIPASSIGQ